MLKLSPTGKPLCIRCSKLATHEIHVSRPDGWVVFSYQCVEHRYASSKLLTLFHIEGLELDEQSYHRPLFVAWLLEHKDVTVGCSADEARCPLAHFYSRYYDMPCRVTFDGEVRTLDGFNEEFALHCLPAWAKAFTLAVDFTHPDTEITGLQALELLTKCMGRG